MFLSASVFSVFGEYVGILLFICLPVIVLSAILAIWLHYRQKKRKAIPEIIPGDSTNFSFSASGNTSHSMAVSSLAPEDKLGLIKECRKQLMKSKAKYFALKSDFTTMKNNIDATENSLPENDSYMKSLNEKITAYEKQVMDLQNKLEVLETVVPVQDEAYYLRQALKERENEIKHLKTIIDKSRESRLQPVNAEAVNQNDNSNDPELQHRLEQLKRENVGLNKRINEQEGELSKNRHLLEHIYKELEPSVVAAGIAEQSPQNKFLTDY